jgi:hypothetical protein
MPKNKHEFSTKILALVCVLATVGALAATGQVLGDANDDGSLTIVDALFAARYYVGFDVQGIDLVAADVNCSGTVTIIDALYMAQHYVGLLTEFPCGTVPTPGETLEPVPTPDPTPEYTPAPNASYVIHVSAVAVNGSAAGPLAVSISAAGAVEGSFRAPFDIGPFDAPFTVSLNAPSTYYTTRLYVFYGIMVESVRYSSTISVTADDAFPERTVVVRYYDDMAAMTAITTPLPSPNPTP